MGRWIDGLHSTAMVVYRSFFGPFPPTEVGHIVHCTYHSHAIFMG